LASGDNQHIFGLEPTIYAGADPGFQVRGAHLKKLRRAEGGTKIFGVFRVKNHDFTPKKSYFFPILGGGGGGGARRVRPPESAPAMVLQENALNITSPMPFTLIRRGLSYGAQRHFQQYFSSIVAVILLV
jgi:hypothetical protein